MTSDPVALLAHLESIRSQTLQRLEGLTQADLDWRPPIVEGDDVEQDWSLGEIFMHLALDEHYLREQIARPLLEGVKPPEGILFLPPPPPYGMSKEVILFWFTRARLITRRLIENGDSRWNLELKHVGGLEAMNGIEWSYGYAGHEAFHHKQIDRTIAVLRY